MNITKTLAALNKPNTIQGESSDIEGSVYKVINWFMGIVGLVAVIVIIIGGVQYMTSTGNPDKVKKAKNTILYGIIGLIIVIFAAVIVNFVIKAATTSNTEVPQPASSYTNENDCKSHNYNWDSGSKTCKN